MSDYRISEKSPFDPSDDSAGLGQSPPSSGLDSGRKMIWKGMTTTELVRHMTELRACLPATKLGDIDLEEQMLLHLAVLQELQVTVMSEEAISLQHKVQVANAVTKAISDLADRSEALYSSERVKRLETALIRTCRDHMSEEACQVFLDAYALLAEKVGA